MAEPHDELSCRQCAVLTRAFRSSCGTERMPVFVIEPVLRWPYRIVIKSKPDPPKPGPASAA